MKQWRVRMAGAFLLTIGAAAVLSAAPRPAMQDGWLAWQGCWRAVGDSQDHLLCIVPEGNGARIVEFAGPKVLSETHVVSDGVPRTVTREGCTGTEQARWSADQQRLFTLADMTCGQNMHRKVTGLMAMKSGSEWLQVQAVGMSGHAVARTRQYVAVALADIPPSVAGQVTANRLASETARYAASEPVDLSDVREAVAAVDETVVENWLTALEQPFDLTGRRLLMLADAGVPASVIDVLVAVSNPQRFAVRDSLQREDREPYGRRGPRPVYDPCWGYRGGYYAPIGYGWGYSYPYSWGSRYGYGYGYGCGYTPWGYDPWGWRPGGTIVVVRGSDEDNDDARVTRGGYSNSGTSKGKAKPRDDSPRSPQPTITTSRPSAGSGGYKGGSSSGGSSGSSTGRTAKPKDK